MHSQYDPLSERNVCRIGADPDSRKPRHLVPLAVFALAGIGIGTALAPDFNKVGEAPEETGKEIRMAQTVAVISPEEDRAGEKQAPVAATAAAKQPRIVRVRAPVAAVSEPVQSQAVAAASESDINPLLRRDIAAVRLANAWQESDIDMARTGSIVREAETIKIADTEAELVAMEEPEQTEEVVLPSLSSEHSASMPKPAKADGLVAGHTTTAVNLRSAPKKGSSVVLVVPANADIRTDNSCKHWCTVVYEGTKGYIYKSFIRRNG